MADFAATLRNTLSKLGDPSGEVREKVYQKAKEALQRKIDALPSTPPQAVIDRQYEKLDAAITEVEQEYVPAPVDDPFDALFDDDSVEVTEVSSTDADAVETDEVVSVEAGEPTPPPTDEPVVPADELVEPTTDTDPVLPPVIGETLDDEPSEEIPSSIDEVVAEIADDTVETAPEVEPLSADDQLGDVLVALEENAPPIAEVPVDSIAVDAADDEADEALKAFLDQTSLDTPQVEEKTAEPVDTLSAALASLDAKTDDGETPEADLDLDAPIMGEVTSQVDDFTDKNTEITPPPEETSAPRWGLLGVLVVVLGLIGGGVYAWGQYEPQIRDALGMAEATDTSEDGVPVRTVPSTVVTPDSETAANEQPPEEEASEIASATGDDDVTKFTQRLTADGTEIDDGPVGTPVSEGEGSSVAELSTGESSVEGAPDANTAADEDTALLDNNTAPAPLPVGQRAVFYEERTGNQAGTTFSGAAIWSVVQEAPASGQEPEPAIRAEASVPDLGLVLEMIIKRNGDDTFPATHLVELFFRVPDTFEGRGVAEVQRIALKETEGEPGNALFAVSAPLDTNIFILALTDAEQAETANLELLGQRNWVDVPMQYVSGRRALITMEKGSSGRDVFDEVLQYWGANPL
ncbi:MAG: hypothetical protein AAGI92_01115 [Pseudomonadota bacterium]